MNPKLWIALFLGLSSMLCLGAAIAYFYAGRPGMAVAFLCYSTANASLIWDAFCQ